MSEYKTRKSAFGEAISHPGYGTIGLYRTHGGDRTLFGSSIKHNDVITMKIHHAEIERTLHHDFIYNVGLPIVEIEMSYSQFAEAITSMGQGEGIPVTIKYTEKDGETPEFDFVNKRIEFEQEYKANTRKAMQQAKDLLDEVNDLFSQKGTLKKADKDKILSDITQLYNSLGPNLEFIGTMFGEQMDKTVMEAKGEVEAFCQHKINTIASQAIAERKEEILKLDNPVDIDMGD